MIHLKNKKGFGLVELMVSTSIGLVGIFFLSQIYSKTLRHGSQSRVIITMQSLSSLIMHSLMDHDFFKTGSDNRNYMENNIVRNCFGKISVCDFSDGSKRKEYPFKIFDGNGYQYSGHDLSPKYFNEYGSSCLGFSRSCPIKVTSTIKVVCPEGTLECSGMDIVEVFVTHSISAPPQYSNLKTEDSLIVREIIVPFRPERSTATTREIHRTFNKIFVTTKRVRTVITRRR